MRTFHKLIPRTGVLLLLSLACLAATALLHIYFLYAAKVGHHLPEESEPGGFVWFAHVFWSVDAMLLAITYGWHRVRNFHPLWRSEYLDWLRTLPWNGTPHLLLGPVHVVWQDAVLLLIPMTIAILSNVINPLCVIDTCAFTYASAHIFTLERSGKHGHAYLVFLLLAVAFALLLNPIVFTLIAVVTLAIVIHGILDALKKLPFDEANPFPNFGFDVNMPVSPSVANFAVVQSNNPASTVRGPGIDRTGWPLGFLAPREQWGGVQRGSLALGIIVPVFAYTYAILRLVWTLNGYYEVAWDAHALKTAFVSVAGLLASGALIRVGIYTSFCASPIGLMGRIATGRVIIPGYDRAWAMPFTAPLLGCLVLYIATIPLGLCPAAIAAAITAGIFVLLTLGPSFEEWMLTGPMRFRETPTGLSSLLMRT